MLRFTLREIFFCTILVAVVLGWIIDHRLLVAANDSLARTAFVWRWRTEHLVWFVGYKGDFTVKWDSSLMTVYHPDGHFVYKSAVAPYVPGVPIDQQTVQIGVKDGKWER